MERQDRYVYQYYTDPWPHAVVDDFFPEDYFWQLRKKFPDVVHPKLKDALFECAYSRDDDLTAYMQDHIPWLHEVFKDDYIKPYDKLHADTVFASQSPGFEYYIHNDMPSKVFGILVYMGDTGEGTRLYYGRTEDTYAKTVEWKPNRAMVWALSEYDMTEGQETFHMYRNLTSEIRDSINTMFRREYDTNSVKF